MPVKAGQINIEIRAAANRLRADMDDSVREVKRIGPAGQQAGKELASGLEVGIHAVEHIAKVASESALAVVGAQKLITAEVIKYSAAASTGGSATEGLVNTYRALRLALSPTPFTVATMATGILAQETIKLVNARAKLIEQQSLIAATSGLSINTVQRIDAVSGISGGNAGNVRNLSSALSDRINTNQTSVRSGLNTLGISSAEGREGEPLDPALLEHIAAAFTSIEDPAKRAQAAVQLFGAGNAAIALKELDSAFVDASQAADKFGLTMDQTSRNQIYQARQEFVRLKAAIQEWGGLKGWWENFKQNTEITAAAAEDMTGRVLRAFHDLVDAKIPGMAELNALIHPGTPLTPAELGGGQARTTDIQTGLTAEQMFAHAQFLKQQQAGTLDGLRGTQSAAQSQSDTAFQTLSDDAAKRQQNPNDPTLLSNSQRLLLAVQQQSGAALATVTAQKIAALEEAAAAEKKAQSIAEQLAAFQGKAGERLQALSDQVTAKALSDDPVSSARFAKDIEVNRDSDRTTPAERAARNAILQVDVDRVQAAEEEKRAASDLASVQKTLADEFTAMGNPLADLAPTRESSHERVRLDDELESRQRDAGERSIRMAGTQSQPGDETGLAQRVLDIRLQTVVAERAILAAHASSYTLEDLTLASEKLTTEELNAQLTYQDSIAEIEKAREQSAIGAGGAYQQQLKAINQQLDALNQIKVTDQNITDIELARAALAQKAAEAQVQQLLALGTIKDGWNAFWIEQQEQAEKPGKILFDGMNDAMNKLSGDLTKLATGQHKKTTFGKDMQSVGNSMVQASMKAMLQKGLGALGKKFGVKAPGGKPDGTAQNPYHVIVDGNGTPVNPLAGIMPSLPPALGKSGGLGGILGGVGGFLGGLFGKVGGGGGAATSVDSSIEFMASGGDADPGKVYGVAEAGEAELISPKNSSRITPLSRLMGGGGSPTYNIDARGADLGAENRVSRAIEAAHNSAVANSQRADAERAKRTPQRRS